MKSAVFYGSSLIGEVEIYSCNKSNPNVGNLAAGELRISHLSPPSDRCPPLAVLYMVAPVALLFKAESKPPAVPLRPAAVAVDSSQLLSMHAACLREKKTAVVPLEDEELHLVAMTSRTKSGIVSRFWGFKVPLGLYNCCLSMLNLRCLGIVFDLDETLIVANTTRSFEDRIDALRRKAYNEVDPQLCTGMLAEIQRYEEDRSFLKQYIEGDQVIDNGKVYKAQMEAVPPLSDSHQAIARPIVRMHEKNIVLTRINPSIRDTSVLVRLRPAWEDLRNYLTAKGRKRFEVFVCTMAERDYALEMWRLLDPNSSLIGSAKLLDKIVCVKAGLRKSLFNVFQDGSCHPSMALVIDDRLKVWDEKDQPRVHVVPPFSPYSTPQAEANSSIPVLCVARNVACNVRGGFFKEFDEGVLPRIGEVLYEDEITNFPSPDVGNYLIAEDDNSALNGNKDPLCFDGMADNETEKRMKEALRNIQGNNIIQRFEPRQLPSNQQIIQSSASTPSVLAPPSLVPVVNLPQAAIQFNRNLTPPGIPEPVLPVAQPSVPEPVLPASQAREEGEVPDSELDPDTRRRLLILQHGQDNRDSTPPFPTRPPLPPQPSFFHGGENHISNQNPRVPSQIPHVDDRMLQSNLLTKHRPFQAEAMPACIMPPRQRFAHSESRTGLTYSPDTDAGVLQKIAKKCGTKVEFVPALCNTKELKFSVEVWFCGDKIGQGIGRTRKEALQRAAEIALQNLANEYVSSVYSDPNKPVHLKDNGFMNETRFGYATSLNESRFTNQRNDDLRQMVETSVSALKDICTTEGYNLVFRDDSTAPDGSSSGEVYAQVEVAGQVLGRGCGANWDEAKLQAADEALGNLKSMAGNQFTRKHHGSPRSPPEGFSKRFKHDLSRPLQKVASSGRYSSDGTQVP